MKWHVRTEPSWRRVIAGLSRLGPRIHRLRGTLIVSEEAGLGSDPGNDLRLRALFAVAACRWARTEVLSIIWMSSWRAAVIASVIRSLTSVLNNDLCSGRLRIGCNTA